MTFSSVKELLSDRKRWYQGYYACKEDGEEVQATHIFAAGWCVIGAIDKVYQNPLSARLATDKLENIIGVKNIVEWNDRPERTYEEILDAVTKAGI